MKQIKTIFVVVLALSVAIWIAANLNMPHDTFYDWRTAFINFTGIGAMIAMSVAMLLSLRPRWAEGMAGGLDKVYRLHKWLGITAGLFAMAHWLWIESPEVLRDLGLIAKGVKPPKPVPVDWWDSVTRALRGSAKDVGEWGLYGMLALIAVALFKRFPYRAFFSVHRVMAVVYGLVVYHSVVLMEKADWMQPLGWLMGVLLIGGTIAMVLSLTRRIGQHSRSTATIAAVQRYEASGVTELTLKSDGRWQGHKAGQFAFLTLDSAEGPHPFTISSAWGKDGRISFMIKGLGDYTRTLPRGLSVGQRVTLEGPYGRFHFGGGKKRQIWVAGGIGITPFMARLEALAGEPDGREVDLFYSTAAYDDALMAGLTRLAQEAGVRLHVKDTVKEGYLTCDEIESAVPQWRDADLWFCGPPAFGDALRAHFTAKGIRNSDIHQELFEMR